ncbi:MAG TPA: hypothetical protein VMS23_06715 [Terrimicrobiaceae bacterium]|nr:hypothetical protein [Terrimicrobiaceae bacterium]
MLGIVVGSLPIALAGLPVPVRLGLAGGPLVCAILLARLGNIGPLVWYMPSNVNYAFRDLGIVLFLACVGLNQARSLPTRFFSPSGLLWLFCGAVITIVPVLAARVFGRVVLKLNVHSRLAGGQPIRPRSPSPMPSSALSYASVYPLTMLLRITVAQVLVILLAK